MNNQNPLALPKPPVKRDVSLNIRLTAEEKQGIEALAIELNMAPSSLARYFVMQAVRFHLARKVNEGNR